MLLVDTTMGIASDLAEVRPPANEDIPSSPPDREALLAAYYELRDRAVLARNAGNLPEALQLCDKALSQATHIGDQALIDLAYCNRCGLAIALSQGGVSSARLREILMRNRSVDIGYYAAYGLSQFFCSEKDYKKALFYAKISLQQAYAIDDAGFIAHSHNELGRLYLSESVLDKAVLECETALEFLPSEFSYLHIAPMGNLGYTKFLLQDYRAGFKCLYQSLRHCRSHAQECAYQEWIHLYLCFGYMELRRWRYAWHHGCRALELAQKLGTMDVVKNSLYLLGNLEKTVGDIGSARDYFQRLQQEFYPDNKDLPRIMLCFETRDLVNLRA